MKLRCNKCVDEKRDEASRKTDNLWLLSINGREYLVCKYHRKGGYLSANSQRDISRVPKAS